MYGLFKTHDLESGMVEVHHSDRVKGYPWPTLGFNHKLPWESWDNELQSVMTHRENLAT